MKLMGVVRQARNRLMVARFLEVLSAALILTLGTAALAAWAFKLLLGTVPLWLAALPAAGMLAALALTLARPPSLRTAALSLDIACGLGERISAALLVQSDPSPAARAVVRDAESAVQDADPGRVPVPFPLRFAWAALPAALLVAAVLVRLPPPKPAEEGPVASTAPVPERIRKEEVPKLFRRSDKLERQASRKNLPEMREIAEAIKALAKELEKREITRSEAMAKISSLQDRMKQVQKDMAAQAQLKQYAKSSADRGAQARQIEQTLKDLGKALEALEKMRDVPADSQQARDLQQQLEQALANQADSMEAIEKMLEAMKDGLTEQERQKMQQQLEELLEELEAVGDLLQEMDDLEALKEELAEGEGD